MSIVPGVVVDKDSSVGHSSDLVSIVPPTHDFGFFRSILFDPIVGFSEIINDVAGTVVSTSREDDTWGAVGLRGEHGRVIDVGLKGHDQEDDDHDGGIEGETALSLLGAGCWDIRRFL